MLEFVGSQLLLYLTISLVLFFPGYFLILAFFGKSKLGALERLVISVGLSILVTDFLMLLISRFGLLFTRTSLVLTLLAFGAVCFAIHKKRFSNAPVEIENKALFNFSTKQVYLIILVLSLSIFLRSAYLQNAVPPSSTDLGHHMYWAKLFAQTGKVQNYVQSDIVEKNEVFKIDTPHPISDFIIGEHLIFTTIGLISGISFISAFPVLILFLIDIFTLLAIFILSLRLFSENPHNKSIAIFALLFSGAIFIIDPPQAKFIGGGVIGNVIGNLLVPLAFYFYIRFLQEKERAFLFFALFFSMGLFYTHHLTALIFLLTLIGFVLLSLLLNFKATKDILLGEKKLAFSPVLLSFFLFAVLFVSVIYTPTYLTNKAVGTVIGTIKKVEHTGLSLVQFRDTIGEARIALGVFGTLLLLAFYRKSVFKFSVLLLISWIVVIAIISLAPDLVKIDIPSGRVANYGAYPFALFSAFALVSIFQQEAGGVWDIFSKRKIFASVFWVIAIFIFLSGLNGNGDYFKSNNNTQKAAETFQTGKYLASKISPDDLLVSDHIYLFADSWIKLFFMRGYNFPIYRANLDRYENGVDKNEFCSRDMVSNPGGDLGRQCFSDLRVDFAMVDKEMDSFQFQKLDNFWQVYSNDEINVYYREK